MAHYWLRYSKRNSLTNYRKYPHIGTKPHLSRKTYMTEPLQARNFTECLDDMSAPWDTVKCRLLSGKDANLYASIYARPIYAITCHIEYTQRISSWQTNRFSTKKPCCVLWNSKVCTLLNSVLRWIQPCAGSSCLMLNTNLNLCSMEGVPDRLCGLVVRVSGYRSRGPGSVPGTTKFS
jgi:hypothetical protein